MWHPVDFIVFFCGKAITQSDTKQAQSYTESQYIIEVI